MSRIDALSGSYIETNAELCVFVPNTARNLGEKAGQENVELISVDSLAALD